MPSPPSPAPVDPTLANAKSSRRPEARRASVYVHFPWCRAKCPYCDFVSYASTDEPAAGYADAVIRELELRAPSFEGRRVESVFFGGGTPSLWDPRELGRVVAAVAARLDLAPAAEITVECNPTSLDESRARGLLAAGVNRLSVGVQSLDDERLRFLGRLHDAAGALAALAGATRAGAARLSADLIFGLPSQSPEAACAEAARLADLGLSHLSCYQLTIEPGTRFGELARRGRLPLADDGAVAETFIALDALLSSRGLGHYEISNYAQAGEEARHNVSYWRGDEYLGLGCGAYGFVRSGSEGTRWRNQTLPARYVEATRAGASDVAESIETLDGEALLRERIMLGLRMADGVDVAAAARDLGAAPWPADRNRAAQALAEKGRIVRDGSRVRIPKAAWLWADDTSARLF